MIRIRPTLCVSPFAALGELVKLLQSAAFNRAKVFILIKIEAGYWTKLQRSRSGPWIWWSEVEQRQTSCTDCVVFNLLTNLHCHSKGWSQICQTQDLLELFWTVRCLRDRESPKVLLGYWSLRNKAKKITNQSLPANSHFPPPKPVGMGPVNLFRLKINVFISPMYGIVTVNILSDTSKLQRYGKSWYWAGSVPCSPRCCRARLRVISRGVDRERSGRVPLRLLLSKANSSKKREMGTNSEALPERCYATVLNASNLLVSLVRPR